MANSRVAICIPSGDHWHAPFALCLIELRDHAVRTMPHVETAVLNQRGCWVQVNREVLVRMALNAGATHVLFLDTDMVFPADLLNRLLQHDAPIVGALYPGRLGLRPRSNSLVPGPSGPTWLAPSDGQQHPAYFTGTGLMLVQCDVFRRIPEPWFPMDYAPSARDFEGEDCGFCKRAREAGFEIRVDSSAWKDIGHIGMHVYSFHEGMGAREFFSRLPATARCNAIAGGVVAVVGPGASPSA